jgi:uncharacterized coiled-coil DUF342 family protein
MLNDIGKSSEGVFAQTIKGATFVVENYQKVLDIIKVLAITYGSYKAALVATNVVTSISTALTKGWTIAEMLRYRAMQLSKIAMNLLNKTMLANPYVFAATAVAALVSAFVIFRKETSQVKTAQELLSKAQEDFGDKLAETQAKIRPYVEELKNANLSEQERLDIYKKLKAIDPEIVKGLDAKTLSYEKLTQNVNSYLDALRKQFRLEANKEALQESIKLENQLQDQIDKTQKKVDEINKKQGKGVKFDIGLEGERIGLEANIDVIKKTLEDQKKVSSELGTKQVKAETEKQGAITRTIKVIEDEITALKNKQKEESTTHEQSVAFDKQIKVLENELEKIRGKSKATTAAEGKEEREINKLIEQRKTLLETIEEIRRGAKQSGLIKEQSELDKINEKYDEAIKKITEYNQKVAEFNKKNKTNVQGIGLININALNAARTEELRNANLKADAEKFRQNLEVQKGIFEQFEEAKKNIGIDKAGEMFAEQRKGFISFKEFLNSEAEKLAPKYF